MSWTAGMTAWGSAWTLPSERALTTLIDDYKTDPVYTQENSTWGFKFTGKAEGYTGNSIFLPSGGGDESDGYADCWSSTGDGTVEARYVGLDYSYGYFSSDWSSGSRSSFCFVRLVLK